MAILAVAPRGAFLDLGPAHYLDKLVHGGPDAGLRAAGSRRRATSPASPPHGASRVADLRVAVQSRPRNADVAAEVVRAGARLHAFEHGDIERVVHAAASAGSLDLLLGIGGAPEGVLEAAIVRAHGGLMQASFAPQSPREVERVAAAGLDPAQLVGLHELCGAPALVVHRTGDGVRARPGGVGPRRRGARPAGRGLGTSRVTHPSRRRVTHP